MEKSRGSLFPDTLHIVDIIIGLCNGISSSFSNVDSRLIYLAYRADLLHPLHVQCSLVVCAPLWYSIDLAFTLTPS